MIEFRLCFKAFFFFLAKQNSLWIVFRVMAGGGKDSRIIPAF